MRSHAAHNRRTLFPREYNLLHPAYWFGTMDARPFALFRIGFGLLMLKEALYHLPLTTFFYSESGAVPMSVLRAMGFDRPVLLGSLPDAALLLFFVVWVLVALGLTLGWRTRWMALLNFVCLISVMQRDPFVASGADMAQAAFGFWSLFIPMGAAYALDSRRNPRPPQMAALPGRLFHAQIVLIYLFTALIKMEGLTWAGGSAVYLALQARMHTFPTGDWLLANAAPDLLRLITHLTLLIEAGWTLLVFAPFAQPYLRALGLLAGAGMHLGIALTMNVPNFPIIMLLSYITLLDSRWLDALERRLGWTHPVATADVLPGGCGGVLAALVRGAGVGIRRGLQSAALLTAFVCVVWINLQNDPGMAATLQIAPIPPPLEKTLQTLELWQNWSMFAPDPLAGDVWFVLVGTGADGIARDLRTGLAPGVVRPRWWIGPDARWPKFEENLVRAGPDSALLRGWGEWACRTYPDVRTVEIRMRSTSPVPPGQPFPPETEAVWWTGDCGGE